MMKFLACFLVCAATLLVAGSTDAARFPRGSSTIPPASPAFHQLLLGGGGFLTGIDISPDGTSVLGRGDVYGAYIFNSGTGQWQQLVTTTRMPAGTAGGGDNGTIEIVSAPSQPTTIYLWWNDGNLYRSLDRGGSFTQLTGFGTHDARSANGNGNWSFGARLNGRKMAVDPINPDVLYVATIDGGIRTSTNATSTASFAAVSGITAAGNANGYTMAFDKNGGSTTGKTNILYVSSAAIGIFKMTAPGGSFSLITATGGPTDPTHMVVDALDQLWIADGSTTLYKYVNGSPGTFSAKTGNSGAHAVAIDPANNSSAATTHVYVANDGGTLSYSADGGATWTANLVGTRTAGAGQPGWVTVTNEGFFSTSDIMFDPSKSNSLLVGEGIGAWNATPPTTFTAFNWNAQIAGIELLPLNAIISPPAFTSTPSTFSWDRPSFYSANQNAYPATVNPSYNTGSIVAGWAADYASSDGSTIAGLMNGAFGNYVEVSGTSTNNGSSWTKFAKSPIKSSGVTTSQVTTNVFTFSGGIPANVYPGMIVVDDDDHGPTNINPGVFVVSTTSTTVTTAQNVLSTIPIGAHISFNGNESGSIATTSPTNMVWVPSNDTSFPFLTTDGGATWSPILIAGTPQNGTGTLTSGSNTVSNLSFNTSNLVVGDQFYAVDGCVGLQNAKVTIASILSATSFTYTGTASSCNDTTAFLQFLTGWSHSFSDKNFFVASDRVDANTYYLFNAIRSKLYFSSNGGASWVAKNVTPSSFQVTYNFQGGSGTEFKAVEGNAGHLFASQGFNGGSFIRSTDHGVTWSAVPGVTGVTAFGFGKPKPSGGGYPEIIIWGTIGGVKGIYYSDDGEQATPTWTFLTTHPVGSLDDVTALEGDKNIYNRFYGGFGGNGAFYYGQ